VFNEEEVLPLFIRELEKVKQGIDLDVKLLLVDDGSRDSTWHLISEAAAKHSWVGGVKLSRNFGHQAALSCGYRLAKGDVVVSMDADLQDPPNLIPEMVAKWRGNCLRVPCNALGIAIVACAFLYLFLQSFMALYDTWRGRSFSNLVVMLAPVCGILAHKRTLLETRFGMPRGARNYARCLRHYLP
jgi:glycosyltransferase involved in cell wall biosynthesis